MTAPYRSRLLLPETLPFTDARERRWFYNYRGWGKSPLFADHFDRDDSTTTLGAPWQSIAGTWGVTGGTAYDPSATANDIAAVDVGVADCTVSARFVVWGFQCGLYVRVVDASNYLRLLRNNTSLILQTCTGGAFATVATLATGITFAAGSVLAARMQGDTITALLDGAQMGASQTVSSFASATKHGIGIGSATAVTRIDDFRVTVP